MLDHKRFMFENVGLCNSSYNQLCQIAQIRKYLTQEAAVTMIHSLVTSKLNSVNALLYGLPDHVIHKLLLIKNHAEKIVEGE